MICAMFLQCKIIRRINAAFYSSSYNTNEVDLLQRSVVPTRHFQKSLPKLPIPNLHESLLRYRESQLSLLNFSEFEKTKMYIAEFSVNEGLKLHKELLQFQKKNNHTNYVNLLWTEKYLKDRQPVVLTHNPTMVFKKTKHQNGPSTQLIRAANMVYSSIRFCRSLKLDLLEPLLYHINKEKTDTDGFRNWIRRVPPAFSWYVAYFFKVFALDMSQLGYLFNTTRIPRPDKDEIRKFDKGNHVLVLHKGQMYIFDIFKENGGGVEPKQILANLKYILSQPAENSQLIGFLPTMNRKKWSEFREDLIKLGNEETLQKIDSSAFALALDSDSYDSDKALILNTLHGPSENRWFDKSFSLILDSKGNAALNFEHSWGDGIAVLTYFEEIFKDSENNPQFSKPLTSSEESQLPSPQVHKLQFNLNQDFTERIIPLAKNDHEARCKLLEFHSGQSVDLDKKYLESAKLDPDAMMQLSFQMAYHKLNNKMPPAYESASTAGFKDGRTETIRPVTVDTRTFCESLNKSSISMDALRQGLSACSKKHNKLKLEALMGNGWDRHLMGLKYFADKSGNVPDIFTDPNYSYINNIIVSTSTVPSESLEIGGFAAVTQDGYGIGYGIRDEECGALVTTWNNSSASNGSQYIEALLESFKKLREIIDSKK